MWRGEAVGVLSGGGLPASIVHGIDSKGSLRLKDRTHTVDHLCSPTWVGTFDGFGRMCTQLSVLQPEGTYTPGMQVYTTSLLDTCKLVEHHCGKKKDSIFFYGPYRYIPS